MWIDDAWVYQQLRQWDLDARRSELDLSDLYKTGDDRPAACPRATPGQPQTSHMASVRQYLPHADGDALSYAHNLLVGVLDRVFPPQLHPSGANWPLPLSVLEWPYFEWLLHTETDFAGYRDHLAHSLRVAVLGRWLIADCNWANTDRDRGRDRQGRLAQAAIKPKRVNQLLAALNLRDDAVTNRVVVAAWWLAALFHDIGYGVQLFGQIEKKIEGALPWYAGDVAAGLVRGCRPETIERSLFLDYLACDDTEPPGWSPRRRPWEAGLYRECLGNHSIAGALVLLMSLDEARTMAGYVDPRLDLIFHLAAEAIFYHDLLPSRRPKCGQSIRCAISWELSNCGKPQHARHTTDCPIGALLALCDSLQDWGRLRLVPRSLPDGCRVLSPCDRTDEISLHLHSGSPPKLEVEGSVYDSDDPGEATLSFLVSERVLCFGSALRITQAPSSP